MLVLQWFSIWSNCQSGDYFCFFWLFSARYDGEYAADITFLNDAKIFLHSITYVFQRRGVVEGGTGTMQQAENSQKKQK